MDRALNGVDEPVYSHGELIRTRKVYNERLLIFMLRNRAPERFGASASGGGSSLKGLNAVGKMEKPRRKKKWREEFRAAWDAELEKTRSHTSVKAVRDSIDRKVEAIRAQVDRERAAQWAKFSDETREAWKRFETLRSADFERLGADEDVRRRHYEGPREMG